MVKMMQTDSPVIFYIHGSVYRESILIRSNKIQHYAVFIYRKFTLHVSGVHCTHHQEYIKLQLQPLVQVVSRNSATTLLRVIT